MVLVGLFYESELGVRACGGGMRVPVWVVCACLMLMMTRTLVSATMMLCVIAVVLGFAAWNIAVVIFDFKVG